MDETKSVVMQLRACVSNLYVPLMCKVKREIRWTHAFLHVLHRLSLADHDGEVGRAFSETHNELS